MLNYIGLFAQIINTGSGILDVVMLCLPPILLLATVTVVLLLIWQARVRRRGYSGMVLSNYSCV